VKEEQARAEVVRYWMDKAHEALKAAVHRCLVKTGELDPSWGWFYDLVFNARQRGDYQELVEFSTEEAEELILQSEQFVSIMNILLENNG
jgi:uncharacterized protein (UPF0332 family)